VFSMTIPLSTIKSALKISYDDDDSDIVRLREAAIALVERRTGLFLHQRTESLYLNAWNDCIVPGVPFVSLTSIAYTDANGAAQTLAASDYWLDRSDGPAPYLRFLAYPYRKDGTAIVATYVAGYSSIPNEITHACIALIGAWYNNPEAFQAVSLSVVPLSVEYILETVSARSVLR
jgi:uncharacterized phiE125 gp8 family phage protein